MPDQRLPFDPRRMRGLQPAPPATLSVRQVNELIRGTLARHLPPTLHVLGEISNLSRPGSGHLYFTLKDAASELRCIMWRSIAARLRFRPEDGMEVIATGGIEVYAPRGAYQLQVRQLEPRGQGALEVAFRQLREKLEREGLFDPARKRPLPRFPQRIALVTSPTGAAIRDILHTLTRRFPILEIFVFPVRVQGEGAAAEIAAAIATVNRLSDALGGIDVLITGRGGGSLEDLWAFNEEVVARAIAASRIPVVSAVGHEVDVSISDLVADLRAPTPTAAAELITPLLTELVTALGRYQAAATRAVCQAVKLARAELARRLKEEPLARPLYRIQQRGQLLDELQNRLRAQLHERLRAARERLATAELELLRYGTGVRFARAHRALEQRLDRMARAATAGLLAAERRLNCALGRAERAGPVPRLARYDDHLRSTAGRLAADVRLLLAHRLRLLEARVQALAACDPRQVLRRGYSLTRHARTRELIRSVAQVHDGLRIVTEVADGEFRATAEDPRQPGLFDAVREP